jgi:hypothetical protein
MEQMKALYKTLNDEDSDYGYSARWATRHVIDTETKKFVDIVDETYDTFEIDGVQFWWYHAKNNEAKHPVLIASWSVQIREDDFREYEEEIDAEVESIISLMKRIDRTGGRLEWED